MSSISYIAVPPDDAAIVFCPLREADLPLLTAWLARPHVHAWWGRDEPVPTLAETRAEYLPCMHADSPVQGYIALLGAEPIGFIQSYVAKDCGDGWWEDETDPGVRGIDQFLCDEEKLGQGLGTRMVAAFVSVLFADPAVTKVQADPDPANARAIRCYEKAGLRAIANLTTPDGAALLMVVERAASGDTSG